MHNKKTVYMNM